MTITKHIRPEVRARPGLQIVRGVGEFYIYQARVQFKPNSSPDSIIFFPSGNTYAFNSQNLRILEKKLPK